MSNKSSLDSLNPHNNGELYVDINDVATIIGVIDSEGDFRPEEECQWAEDEIRDEIRRQMTGGHPDVDPDWNWDECYYRFTGLPNPNKWG